MQPGVAPGGEFRKAFARSRSREVVTLAATRPDGSAVPHSTLVNLVRALVGTVADDNQGVLGPSSLNVTCAGVSLGLGGDVLCNDRA